MTDDLAAALDLIRAALEARAEPEPLERPKVPSYRACPVCESTDVGVLDSRAWECSDGNLITRRCHCRACLSRWATEERFTHLIQVEGERVRRGRDADG